MSVRKSITSLIIFLICGATSWAQQQDTTKARAQADFNSLLKSRFGTEAIGESTRLQDPEEPFNNGNLWDAWQLIQGRMAGVSVTRPGGDPNADYIVRIRSLNTMISGAEPLIVVDGVAGISLDNIDPNNIASIEVLKDAAAGSFYGMRGANGVVLVTTKEAREGPLQVSFFSSISVDQVSRQHETISTAEWINRGGINLGADTDFFDEITHTGLSENLGLSIRQNLGNTSFGASVNYRDIEGIAGASRTRRLNTAFYLTHKALDDRFTASFRFASTTDNSRDVNPVVFRESIITNPTTPIFDASGPGGYFNPGGFGLFNPVAVLNEEIFQDERKRQLMTVSLSYQLTDNLKIATQYTEDRFSELSGEYYGRFDLFIGTNSQGFASRNTTDTDTRLFDLTLHYQGQLSEDLTFDAQVGTGLQDRESQGFSATSSQFLFDTQTFNSLGSGLPNQFGGIHARSLRSEDRINSYYGNIAVTFKENLHAFFNLRADTYSGFINDQTGIFYGGGLRYDLTSVMDAGNLSRLSVRASYGTTGNLPRDPTWALPVFLPGGIIDLDGNDETTNDRFRDLIQTWNRNPELTWETVSEFTLGIDFGLESLGLTGSFDYFNRNSKDLYYREGVLIGSPNVFDPGTAFTAGVVYSNFFDLASSGIELSLNYQNSKSAKRQWLSQLNMTFYQQPTIERMNSASGFAPELLTGFGFLSTGNGANFVTQQRLGGEVGALHAPVYLGQDQQGRPLLDSGQGLASWGLAGSSLPSADIGFYNSLTQGDWYFNALLRGSFGHSMLNVMRMIHEADDFSSRFFNRITSDEDQNLTFSAISDLFVEDASFLRLNHVTLGRNFELGSGTKLSAELTAQNLFTLTSYLGTDPEPRYLDATNNFDQFQALASGIDNRELYFPTRTYTFTLRLNF